MSGAHHHQRQRRPPGTWAPAGAERDDAVSVFCDHIMELCSQACDVGQRLKSGEVPWKKAATVEKQFVRELNAICKQPLRFKPAETLRTYLISSEQKHLFTFLRIPGVPPTNNHAEQSLRHMVIFRPRLKGK